MNRRQRARRLKRARDHQGGAGRKVRDAFEAANEAGATGVVEDPRIFVVLSKALEEAAKGTPPGEIPVVALRGRRADNADALAVVRLSALLRAGRALPAFGEAGEEKGGGPVG